MSRPPTIVSSTTVYAVLACTFFMRALIPVGYMPGNLLDGQFLRLCPAGLPAFAGHDGHGDHHEGADTLPAEIDSGPVCPIGATLGQAGLPGALPATPAPATAARLTAPAIEESLPAPAGAAFRSRAPPAILV